MESYRMDLAAEELYHYIWHKFADLIVEGSKSIFKSGTEEQKLSRKKLLRSILEDSLKLLHPFMPYVTEAIWEKLPQKEVDLLIIAPWPAPKT